MVTGVRRASLRTRRGGTSRSDDSRLAPASRTLLRSRETNPATPSRLTSRRDPPGCVPVRVGQENAGLATTRYQDLARRLFRNAYFVSATWPPGPPGKDSGGLRRAVDRGRTGDIQLGKLALCRLSYNRKLLPGFVFRSPGVLRFQPGRSSPSDQDASRSPDTGLPLPCRTVVSPGNDPEHPPGGDPSLPYRPRATTAIRTRDLRRTRTMLFQLSYGGEAGDQGFEP